MYSFEEKMSIANANLSNAWPNEWMMLKNFEKPGVFFFSIPHNIVYRSQKESLVNKKNLYWQDLKHFLSFLGFLVTENPRTIVIYLHSSTVTNVIEVIKAYCLYKSKCRIGNDEKSIRINAEKYSTYFDFSIEITLQTDEVIFRVKVIQNENLNIPIPIQ